MRLNEKENLETSITQHIVNFSSTLMFKYDLFSAAMFSLLVWGLRGCRKKLARVIGWRS